MIALRDSRCVIDEASLPNWRVDAEFVGHPLAYLPTPAVTREEYATAHDLDAAKQWIALLPGSRGKEVAANVPAMLDAAALVGDGYEFLLPVASTLDRGWVESQIGRWREWAAGKAAPPVSTLHLVSDAREALQHVRASIVASGTATVQSAVIGNP